MMPSWMTAMPSCARSTKFLYFSSLSWSLLSESLRSVMSTATPSMLGVLSGPK